MFKSEQAARAATRSSGAGCSTDPMPVNATTPKQPRRGDRAPLSPHLDPAVGGSGGRESHGIVTYTPAWVRNYW